MNWLSQVAAYIGRLRFWFTVRPWERALRVRLGSRVREFGPGIHVRVPWFDEVLVMNVRIRTCNLPNQSVTAKDGTTITASAVVMWRIVDIEKLWRQLCSPEDWIYNTALPAIAQAITEQSGKALNLGAVGDAALNALLMAKEHGLEVIQVGVTDLVRAPAFRLIQDQHNPFGFKGNMLEAGFASAPIGGAPSPVAW